MHRPIWKRETRLPRQLTDPATRTTAIILDDTPGGLGAGVAVSVMAVLAVLLQPSAVTATLPVLVRRSDVPLPSE